MVAEEYLSELTHAKGQSHCGRYISSELEFRFQPDWLEETYVVDHMYTQFRLGQNSTWAGFSGTQLLRKSGSVCICIFFNGSTAPWGPRPPHFFETSRSHI
jgi:hypothetical protein